MCILFLYTINTRERESLRECDRERIEYVSATSGIRALVFPLEGYEADLRFEVDSGRNQIDRSRSFRSISGQDSHRGI